MRFSIDNKIFIDTDVIEVAQENSFVKGVGIYVKTNWVFQNTLEEHYDIKCTIITDPRIENRISKKILARFLSMVKLDFQKISILLLILKFLSDIKLELNLLFP